MNGIELENKERADAVADVDAARRIVDGFDALRRALDETRAENDELRRDVEIARHNAAIGDQRLVDANDAIAQAETARREAEEKNAALLNLVEALKRESRERLDKLQETRVKLIGAERREDAARFERDKFEREASEARFENWIWRVVGFIAATVAVGSAWVR